MDQATSPPGCSALSRPLVSLPFHCEKHPRSARAGRDDHAQLAAHMSKSSWMMLGSRMAVELDASQGRAMGSHIRLKGRVLSIPLFVEEVVVERQPPRRKAWQTTRLNRGAH